MEPKDIILLLVFHSLLFYCWRKMILFLKKGEKKHVKMGWAFIGLYFLLCLLQWYVSGWGNDGAMLGLNIPMYVLFGLAMIYFPLRVIPPLKTEVNRRIKNIMSES